MRGSVEVVELAGLGGLRAQLAGADAGGSLRSATPAVVRALADRLARADAFVRSAFGTGSGAAPSALAGLGLGDAEDGTQPYWTQNPMAEVSALLRHCSDDVGPDPITKYECAYGVIMTHVGEMTATANIAFGVQHATRQAAAIWQGEIWREKRDLWNLYASSLQNVATFLRDRDASWRRIIAKIHADTRFFAGLRDDLVANAQDYVEPARTEALTYLNTIIANFRAPIVHLVDLSLTEAKLARAVQKNIVAIVALTFKEATAAVQAYAKVSAEYIAELRRSLNRSCDFLCQIGRGMTGAVDLVFRQIPTAIGQGIGGGTGGAIGGFLDAVVKPLILPAVLVGGGYVAYTGIIKPELDRQNRKRDSKSSK